MQKTCKYNHFFWFLGCNCVNYCMSIAHGGGPNAVRQQVLFFENKVKSIEIREFIRNFARIFKTHKKDK